MAHQVELLQKEKQDLQSRVDGLKANLADEIRDRHAAEEKLQKHIQELPREKRDLETLVQILVRFR